MAIRPTEIPVFATDPTLTGGPQVGLAARVRPSTGLLTQGFYQGRRVPARFLSWIIGMICDWLGYLDTRQEHNAMRFARTALSVGTSSLTRLSAVQQLAAIGTPANRQQMILASGSTTGTFPSFELMNDGTAPSSIVNYGGGGTLTCAPACDSSGVLFWGDSAGLVKSSSNGGASSSNVTVAGLTGNVTWAGFTSSHYLLFEASTQKLYRATSLGGTWTSVTLGCTSVWDIATNGAGTWVLFGAAFAGSEPLYSTDDGVTWTPTIAFGGTGSVPGGGWSTDLQTFFALEGHSGLLYTSPDGITWTLSRTVAGLVGVSFAQHSVAVCGNALACVVNRAVTAINKYPFGIAYTLDAGATWYETYFGDPFGTNPIASLLSANGRLYAIDGANLYQSGLIAAPPSLFTGV